MSPMLPDLIRARIPDEFVTFRHGPLDPITCTGLAFLPAR